MTLTYPKALFLAVLAVPIVLVYLRRARPRRRSVAAGFLWEQVLGAPGRRSAWWTYRHPVSLGVQLVVLAMLVVALAGPRFGAPATVVLLVDHSASMNATDQSPSRLDRAKDLVRRNVMALGRGDRAAILAVADGLALQCPLTSRRDLLEPALARIGSSQEGTRMWEAVGLARRLLEAAPNGRIVVFSDGCFAGAAELAGKDDLELVLVGKRSDNLAITRLETRRGVADPRRCQVLAEVTSFADETATCRIEVGMDEADGPTRSEPVALEPGDRWQHVFEFAAPAAARIIARLDRPDVLLDDNRASAPVPPMPNGRATPSADGRAPPEAAIRVISPWEPNGAITFRAVESELRPPQGIISHSVSPAPAVAATGPPAWWLLAAGALALVVAEWYGFQRRWTC